MTEICFNSKIMAVRLETVQETLIIAGFLNGIKIIFLLHNTVFLENLKQHAELTANYPVLTFDTLSF